MRGVRFLVVACAALLLQACASSGNGKLDEFPSQPEPVRPPPVAVKPLHFSDLPGWEQEDHAAGLDAFRATCAAPPSAAPRHDAALAAGLDALATWDARETLRRLRIPTLVLAAPDDPVVPLPLAHATAALAVAACRVVPFGGHLLPITQPAWCAAEIAAFLAQ